MKYKSKNTILLFIPILIVSIIYIKVKNDDNELDKFNEISISESSRNINEMPNKSKKEIKNHKVLLSKRAGQLSEELKSVSVDELKYNWRKEFGCFSRQDNEETGIDLCDNIYLTARSFEESLWMQRQGYPSNSNLQLLNDNEDLVYIQELARNNNTQAMALLIIKGLNEKNYDAASSMALKLRAYSDQRNTFPHRVRGEVLLANNDVFYGLSALKVASLLGDNESQYLFNRYLHKHPNIAIDAVDHANLYMGRIFGVPYGQYPRDERPKDKGTNGG